MAILLSLALKSLLIAGITLAVLHFTSRRSAAERSLIAHLGLFALVALPLGSLALPSLHVGLPDSFAPAPAADAPVVAQASQIVAAPVEAAAATAPNLAASATFDGKLAASFDWAPFAYAAPAVALLLITLLALLRLVALRSRAQVLVDPVWLTALAHAQRRMGFKSGTALLISNELVSPISWGVLRPVILLNDEALGASDEAEAIIAHELAHVARFDWAKLMLARVATAVFWFNPLAWVLAREAHQLREEAADDAVLAANIEGTDYAQLLVGVARHECRGILLGAHGVAPSKGSLRRRVSRVLDETLARGPAGKSWMAGFAAGMMVMAAPLAALTFAPGEKLPEDSLIGKTGTEGRSWTLADNSRGPVPAGVISNTVAKAVETSVAAAAAGAPDAAMAAEMASDAVLDAHDVRSRARLAREHARDPVDLAIAWKAVGVTPEYAARVRAAAPYMRIADDDLLAMKAVGVTPAYIAEMGRAGYRPADVGDLVGAYAVGVSPAFVRDMAAAGYRNLSLDQLTGMRALGVDAAYVRGLRAAGVKDLTPDRLTELRARRISAKALKAMREMPDPPDPPEPPEPPPGVDEDN